MARDDAPTLEDAYRLASAERDRLRGLFERMGHGYCELELLRDASRAVTDFRYHTVNPAFERMFGIPVEQATGVTASALFPDLDRYWHEIYGRIADTGEPARIEEQVSSMGRWFEVFAYPTGCNMLTLLFEDVTERRLAVDALRESQERLSLAIEVGGLGSWDWDIRTGNVTWNDRHFLLQGYAIDEVAPSFEAWLARVHPDDRQETLERIEHARRDGTIYAHVFRTLEPSGRTLWCSARGQFYYDERGDAIRMIGIMEDVTARKATEQALQRREADLARVQRIGRVGGLDIDVAGGMRSRRSPEYLRLHGLGVDSIDETHDDWLARVVPEDREQADRTLFEALNSDATTYDGEYRIRRPSDGAIRWIHARADIERAPDGAALRLVGAHLDVTDQKRLQEELRSSDERRGFLLRLSDALRPLSDPIEIEDAACRMLGEYLGVDWVQYSDIDVDRGVITHRRDFFRAGDGTLGGVPSLIGIYNLAAFEVQAAAWAEGRSIAIENVATDASLGEGERMGMLERAVHAALTVPVVKDGRPHAVMAVLHGWPRNWRPLDIALAEETADRTWAAVRNARAEHALRESEAQFREFAAASSAGLWIRNAADLAMTYASPAVSAIYGVDVSELLGPIPRWIGHVVPEDRPDAPLHFEVAREGRSGSNEFRIQRPDGSVRWVRSACFPLPDADGTIRRIGGTVEDVTEKRAAAEHQATLLAELQHRVRNVLAVTRSIVARTYTEERSAADFLQHLDGRISALARTQALLTRRLGIGVDLYEMIADELLAQAAEDDQFELSGPDIALPSKIAEIVGLAVHELATNATKYGALTRDTGRLTIAWKIEQRETERWLTLQWHEQGVPIVQGERPRVGFGTELITRRIPYELRGHGDIVFAPGGVRATITLPFPDGAEAPLEAGAS